MLSDLANLEAKRGPKAIVTSCKRWAFPMNYVTRKLNFNRNFVADFPSRIEKWRGAARLWHRNIYPTIKDLWNRSGFNYIPNGGNCDTRILSMGGAWFNPQRWSLCTHTIWQLLIHARKYATDQWEIMPPGSPYPIIQFGKATVMRKRASDTSLRLCSSNQSLGTEAMWTILWRPQRDLLLWDVGATIHKHNELILKFELAEFRIISFVQEHCAIIIELNRKV